MSENYNTLLIIGAGLSAVAALLHVGIVIGGPAWYRFFGAGERFVSAAAAGRWWPACATFGIAGVLGLWAAYALSGAGVIQPLPLLRLALVLITTVYLLRGLALVPAFLATGRKVTSFLFWSSVVCAGYGAFHLLGLVQVWSRLSLNVNV
jgi:hypothetical protein